MLSMYGYEYEMKMDASLWKAESILGGNKNDIFIDHVQNYVLYILLVKKEGCLVRT